MAVAKPEMVLLQISSMNTRSFFEDGLLNGVNVYPRLWDTQRSNSSDNDVTLNSMAATSRVVWLAFFFYMSWAT